MGRGIRNWSLVCIVLLALGLRLRGISNPLLDNQGWRQADTASMATHMLGHLTQIPQVFFPVLNYDGPTPQRVELEFPFLPYLLAWTWTFVGWADIWGRLWAVFLALVTIAGIYHLGKGMFSERVGLFAAAIYALMPLSIYYGRVVMPEPMAQAWSIWALALVWDWKNSAKEKGSWKAALIMAGAILAKLPQLMLFPVALILGFWPLKSKRATALILYCVIALLLPMVYYLWVHYYAPPASQFVSGIVTGNMGESGQLNWKLLEKNIRQGFTTSILVLAGAGLGRLLFYNSPVRLALITWAGIAALYVGVVCVRIPLDYYLVPVLPLVALLGAYALDIVKDMRGIILVLLILARLNWDSYAYLNPKYQWERGYLFQAQWLKENTPEFSILVLSDSPPMTFYYAQRVGFRLTSPVQDSEGVRKLAQLYPAAYLVRLPQSGQTEEFWKQVQQTYPEIGPGIFALKGLGR